MLLLSDRHRYFVVIPLSAAFIWFSTLLSMLLTWLISGRPKYVPAQPTVSYISDIGASFLKPLFVVACCTTGSCFFLSLVIERDLRHKGRLVPELHKPERILGQLAVVGAFVAMLGLAFLSGFDTGRYPIVHMFFLLVFMIGVVLSAIFTIIRFGLFARDHVEIEQLQTAYKAKAAIGSTLIALAVAFGMAFIYARNIAGVIEWSVGFGFTLYLLTCAYDLRMATVISGDDVSEQKMVEIP